MPMERAVPAMVLIAGLERAGGQCPFSFSFAMSSTCFLVTWPTFSLPGLCAPEPFFFSVCRPAAFFKRTAAGGVLRMKVKERS